MPVITRLRVQHVRTHSDYSLAVSPTTTLITGANGSGKTSLIEAVHISLQGSSFKGSDTEVLQSDAPWYRIDVLFDDGSERTVKFDPSRPNGKKQFVFDGKTHYRLTHQYKYPVVLFEPEDLRLLNGSPTRRRQFIDKFISQLDPEYALSIRRYERALKQRNTLLKRPYVSADDLFAWNVSLSEYGAYIISRRVHFVNQLNERLNSTYRAISRSKDVVTMHYSYGDSPNLKQKLLSELHAHTERDAVLGFTSTGPHRHDVLFDFNGSPALTVASRGEVRTIILALKFLEVDIIESLTGKKPIILLDDVFSELDDDRQATVVKQFASHQTIVASVGAVDADGTVVGL
ncbi:MAG TPA: DNA replication and repair protein RecF [Candidatus Saccharimonadales bacterium]